MEENIIEYSEITKDHLIESSEGIFILSYPFKVMSVSQFAEECEQEASIIHQQKDRRERGSKLPILDFVELFRRNDGKGQWFVVLNEKATTYKESLKMKRVLRKSKKLKKRKK